MKHNDANGEGNRDGSNDNFSWNCGAEGLDGAHEGVLALRRRQMRNFMVALLMSQGTPMVLAGASRRHRRPHRGRGAVCGDDSSPQSGKGVLGCSVLTPPSQLPQATSTLTHAAATTIGMATTGS